MRTRCLFNISNAWGGGGGEGGAFVRKNAKLKE